MSLAVVHLVRRGNPAVWLDWFVRSYSGHDAGLTHDLVVILKGFQAPAEMRTRILADLPGTQFIEIDDTGFDINAYRSAAGALGHDRLCFLNSHSRIEADGWLEKIAGPVVEPEVGAVGATGSWEVMNDRTPFPNIHLRTTGFSMRRAEFLGLDFGPLATKRDCNWFEGGPDSLTRQVLATGRRVLVAGRGGLHAPEDWPESLTFRMGQQEHLLLSDNRTRAFDRAWPWKRRRLARKAWGDRAWPGATSTLRVAARRLGL